MKRISNWAIIALLAFSSCAKDFNSYDPSEEIKNNAENVFGIIDPNQDWRTVTSGTVTITANADLDDITKVQILTESPFFNDQAKILAEAEVTAGQTVTLNYDAPRSNSRLIAACVDSNGKYYIKGFNMEDKAVSFRPSAPAMTRGIGITRAPSELPNLSLDFNESFLSYNAIRTLSNNSSWKDKNWENDRLWQPTGSENYNGWTISNSTIYRNATALTEDEAATLKDIFDASLSRYDGGKPRNNLQFINESSIVQLYGNHLESNGKAAITLCPVQAASTEAYWCDIYYYYYRTEDIPGGTSEADYIKTLPKFKAIDVNDERQAFSAVTGIALTAKDDHFIRLHEYLLPFYGNASEFTPRPSTLSMYNYTSDGKFYRISNLSGGTTHYITNGAKDDDLKGAYTENIEEQLWQIFKHKTNGTFMFYNVGSKKFLWCNGADGEVGRPEIKKISENSLQNYTFYITDSKINPTESRTKVYLYTYNKNKCFKSDGGTKLGIGNKGSTNDTREWTFEEYSESYFGSVSPISDFNLPFDLFPGSIATPSEPVSAIIPEGYRIGFMIRKNGGEETEKVYLDKQGCLYGYGELNTEINTYGQFKSAVNYGMELNSPRMATFTANNKVYLCFEEGADTQYSDVIVELGSTGELGVLMFDYVQEVKNMPYTMCFEDRPNIADYDMNDVVLRCTRKSATQLELSLIATGAQDQVNIEGIEGTFVSGTDLNNKEVHGLFGVSNSTYVNTQLADNVISPVTAVYEVSESTTIPQFLTKIYIRNISQNGNEIRVPKLGEPPFALIVPGDFNYPIERVSIINAYTAFNTWANNANNYGRWLDSFVESKIYPNPSSR